PLRVEEAGTTIGAGGHVMKMIEVVKMSQPRHEKILPQLQSGMSQASQIDVCATRAMSAPPAVKMSQTSQIDVCATRVGFNPEYRRHHKSMSAPLADHDFSLRSAFIERRYNAKMQVFLQTPPNVTLARLTAFIAITAPQDNP
ncbi:MAG TPA: hypothetical protein VGV68_05550, partial [Terriglobia bacterium]|nr:hypothetical protein [Terriglobia bacterium]